MSTGAEYRKLLVKYAPQPIRSERDYRRALRQLESLMLPHPDVARSRIIEVLSILVEQYESRVCETSHLSPGAMLAHLLQARGVKCATVAKETGISAATLSSVLSNQRGISKTNAVLLARYFHVSPVVFLEEASKPDGQLQNM